MGRGDKKTRKGKINRGSYGNSRPKPSKGYKPKEEGKEVKKEEKTAEA